MIVTVDGGPDENPRYTKTIVCAVDYFTTYNMDALFVATNAPGRSAFNRVERRMAPLSHDLAGIVLPHDHFGSHLNQSGETVQEEIETQNFAHAGQVLAEIWSDTVIDGHPTVAEYIAPTDEEEPVLEKDRDWHSKHVRESQYMLQIVKCYDRSCCDEPRSSYFTVIKDRFLPPPLPLLQTEDGLAYGRNDENARFPSLFVQILLGTSVLAPRTKKIYAKGIPYDFACPNLDPAELRKRICGKCGLYHASIKSMKEHYRLCRQSRQTELPRHAPLECVRPIRVAAKRQRELMCLISYMENEEYEWLDEEDVDVQGLQIPSSTEQSGTPLLPPEAREPAWEEDV